MNYRYQFYAIRALAFIFNLFPFSFSSWIAKNVGRVFYFCVAGRRNIALGNLEKAYGNTLSPQQKKTLARKSFENTALSVLELFLIKKFS